MARNSASDNAPTPALAIVPSGLGTEVTLVRARLKMSLSSLGFLGTTKSVSSIPCSAYGDGVSSCAAPTPWPKSVREEID